MTIATAYYLLTADAPAPGTAVAAFTGSGAPVYAVADPRHAVLSEVFGDDPAQNLLYGSCQLVEVRPAGCVEGKDGVYRCDDGWTAAASWTPLAALGPQARQVLAVVARAEQAVAVGGEQWDAYVDAANAMYRDHAAEWKAADNAARLALTAVGADAFWWSTLGGDAYGPEILALAARDLIGQVPGWIQPAYDLLVGPWAAAFGPAHPGDLGAPGVCDMITPAGPARVKVRRASSGRAS